MVGLNPQRSYKHSRIMLYILATYLSKYGKFRKEFLKIWQNCNTSFLQKSFLCVVALDNLCLLPSDENLPLPTQKCCLRSITNGVDISNKCISHHLPPIS